MLSAHSKPKHLVALGLLLFSMAVFCPALRNGFVNYDDDVYVYANASIKSGITLPSLKWAFTTFHASNWHPLTWISHMLDWRLFGPSPAGHHLTSVLLHSASAALLFYALGDLTKSLGRSAFAAALFAVHPLRVESVAWVAERKDVLAGFFFMLTLVCYARYAQRPKSLGNYLLVVGAFTLGLLAKASLVTLPFVLLLLDWWPLHRFKHSEDSVLTPLHAPSRWSLAGRLCLEKIPLFLLSAGACAATLFAQRAEVSFHAGAPASLRWENALIAYGEYLRDFVWPAALAPLYPMPAHPIALGAWLPCLLLLVSVSTAAILMRPRKPYLLVGWLWHLGVLIPMLGIIQVGNQARADRYTYLSQIGLAIALVWLIRDLAGYLRVPKGVQLAGGGIALASLAICAQQQIGCWRDGRTLWTSTLARTANNFIAEDNLGVIDASEGRLPEALSHFKKALAANSQFAESESNLGLALAGMGRTDEAIEHYRRAIELRPLFALVHDNLGLALSSKGRIDEAASEYQIALALDPTDAKACNNLGIASANQGDLDGAIRWFERSLALQPLEASTIKNLATLRRSKARRDQER